MTISANTANGVAFILVDEVGTNKAIDIVDKIIKRIDGNKSFQDAMQRVREELAK